MRTRILIALASLLAGALFIGHLQRPELYVSHYENVLGTSLELKVLARTAKAAERAESAVLTEIEREAGILSAYDTTSEFSRWTRSAGVPTPVSAELFEILGLFDSWRARTGGALDASAETVTRVWKTAAGAGRLPTEHELAAAVRLVRQAHWRLDPAAHTATHTSGAPLMLNSFTKSFIVDRAARRALAVRGIEGVLVNVGGDLVVRGTWTQTVGIADPVANADNSTPIAQVAVRDRAVATSGGYKRGFDIGGQHYSHIVDPRTAWPTGHVLSATVVAPGAVDAGALATALCVLKPDEGAALARTLPDTEFLLVLENGRRIESAGWGRVEVRSPERTRIAPVATVYAAEQSPWPQGFELQVSLELNRANAFGRRPYVAVWIEDKDHFPVRTVGVWYDRYRYLPELRAWYRSDRLRAVAEGRELIDSVSSATRPPGKYMLKWDGKDNQGKFVGAGTYTVFIEATREHGGYQVIKQEMEFSDTPKHVDLPGGAELSAASLDYHKAG